MKLLVQSGWLVAAMLACSCGSRKAPKPTAGVTSPQTPRQVIRVKAEAGMVVLCQAWAEAYARSKPDQPGVDVSNGPDPVSLRALENRHVDIVASSHRLPLTNELPR
jgi:hypothetical protein